MEEYRIYTVGSDGHFIGVETLVCDDDAQAVEKAKQLLNGLDIQIWSGPRYVGGLRAKISPGGSSAIIGCMSPQDKGSQPEPSHPDETLDHASTRPR